MKLGPLIEAARDLAWRPMSNTSRRDVHEARLASHQRLLDALEAIYQLRGALIVWMHAEVAA